MKKVSRSNGARGKTSRGNAAEDMRAEYDFRGGIRGKYARRLARGSNLVLLDPDIASRFRSDRAVNRALRDYLTRKPK